MTATTNIAPALLDKDAVRGVYERIAPLYDAWALLTETRARRACLDLARVRDGESVLEVAVGTGMTFAELLARNPSGRNEGIDLTEGMLRRAQERARRVGRGAFHLALGDAYALDFPEASFDLVVNNYMFDLLPEEDFPRVLAEFHRVLRPGGRLVLVNMTKGERLQHRLAEAVYRFNPALMGGCRGVTLEPFVRAAGFEVARREVAVQLTFPSEIISASRS